VRVKNWTAIELQEIDVRDTVKQADGDAADGHELPLGILLHSRR
jgi:hypothetical protein